MLTSEIEQDLYWDYKNISIHNYRPSSFLGVNINPTKLGQKGANFWRQENQTLAEHFFSKTGVYLSKKENDYLFKCSKERCLLDFSI